MATLIWPSEELRKRANYSYLRNVPFVICENEEYPEPINEYITNRVNGRILPKDVTKYVFKLKPVQREAAKQIGYAICDFITWLETGLVHPTLGVMHWKDTRAWHITELYYDAMLIGVWSENFWQTREPAPLSPESADRKVAEVLRCFTWCQHHGFVSRFTDTAPLWQIEEAKQATLKLLEDEANLFEAPSGRNRYRRIRQQPGNSPPPTPAHLQAFLMELEPPVRLAGIHIFETGMRTEEVVENSLIPGRIHRRRSGDEAWCWHSSWPLEHYLLEHHLQDNRMLGVLPTPEMAWSGTDSLDYQCSYRILGKGPKIRLVHLPPALVRAIWKFIDSSREHLQLEADLRGYDVSAYTYLNRFGAQLSYSAVRQAFARANKRLDAPIDITGHVLRHAYACYFLEVAIIEQGRRQGYDPDNLPSALIQRFGETVLLVIKVELGHEEFSTTQKYLTQLVHGRIGFTYRNAFNDWLDQYEGALSV